ncbi:MAG: endonuclease domain-containing protein [Actinomycetota bacterium]|nr:endonuclease domain-containing protein [Actinomycetota bacterium]
MDVSIAKLAGSQFNRVSRRQLVELGATVDAIDHRVATGRLVIVAEGVFAVAPVLDYDKRGFWMSATLTSPDSFLARESAACALGVLSKDPSGVSVVRPGSGGPRRMSGVTVYRSSTLDGETTEHEGIPVTTLPRVLLDLACCVGNAALARALREAIRLHPLTIHELSDWHGQRLHRRGAVRLARVIARYGGLPIERARSGAEVRALELLRDAGVELPRLNVDIAGVEADLSWPSLKLIIEIDGGPFHEDAGEDARKEAAWRAAGWEVRRIDSDDVYERPRNLLTIAPSGGETSNAPRYTR